MNKERAKRRAEQLGPPHFAFHAGRNKWQVRKPGEGGERDSVVDQ